MRVIVVGLGVQGEKRRRIAGLDCVACVDPDKPGVDFKYIQDVPLTSYDAALCCIPDAPKYEVIKHCLLGGKHVLVEKPLWTPSSLELVELFDLAKRRGLVCYTAYNHRFEPHVVRMKVLIESGQLGRLYSCRLFYGNGTARQVRDSIWRDKGSGVLADLGSHLLDFCRFWFGEVDGNFTLQSARRFENVAPDHVVISNETSHPRLELEMSLISWRNGFSCDLYAEKGSAHIHSFCKWGSTTFVHRTRVFPSGRPPEESITLVQDDPTWALEYDNFKTLCAKCEQGDQRDVALWVDKTLKSLATEVNGL